MSQKRCSICKKTKPLDEFQKSVASKDGKYCQCRECQNAAQRKIKQANDTHALRLSFLGVTASHGGWGHYV